MINPMPVVMIKPRSSPPNNAPSIPPMFSFESDIYIYIYYIKYYLKGRQTRHALSAETIKYFLHITIVF